MRTETTIRVEIRKKIREIYKLRKAGSKFIPGKSPINYAGRIYNEKEMINLVDSSVDFWLTAGKYAGRFEKKLAEFIGTKYCLLVNSGSSANLLAVSALTSPLLKDRRLKAGDEVITTSCGFPTTLNPIIQNNLIPVLVDIELGTYNIHAADIEKAITKNTKAIVVAHTLGNPADLGKISNIAKKHKLWFIEDNCDALGSKYSGRNTGTFGDISTCSFYPAHHITTGEGGALLTDDPILRRIILSMRDWGRDCWCETGHDNTCGRRFSQKFGKLPFGYDHKYVYSHIGYNLKLTDMQAAVGLEQLKKVTMFIDIRKKNFAAIYKIFKKYEKFVVLPKKLPQADPSWFGFPVLVKPDANFKRNKIVEYLENNKIATRMLFGGNLIKQPAYKDIKYRAVSRLDNTDLIMNNLFWIGVYPGINRVKLTYIKSIVDNFFRYKL